MARMLLKMVFDSVWKSKYEVWVLEITQFLLDAQCVAFEVCIQKAVPR
jgi:hypothetical protein